MAEAATVPRASDRDAANRIYFSIAAVIGGLVAIYFLFVPFIGLNLAFHSYLMLWITMASAFNVAAGFSGYMPFGYVAFYGIGAFTTAILVFIFSWNEFPIALSLTSRENATVPVAIARFAQQYEIQHAQMAAASVISTIPAVLLMFVGQRFIISGLTLGAVK